MEILLPAMHSWLVCSYVNHHHDEHDDDDHDDDEHYDNDHDDDDDVNVCAR